MIALTNKIACQAGKRDIVAEIIATGSQDMPGCVFYSLAFDAEDVNAIWVSEIWTSEEAQAASLGLPQVREAIERAGPYLAGGDRIQAGAHFRVVTNAF